MVTVLQAHCLLRLCHPEGCSIDLPDSLPLTIDLLNVTLAPCNQQIARLRHFLDRPRQETVPALQFLAVGIILMDAAQGHIGNQQCAT